ncbi:hypothetical protein MTZ49_01530 [Entomomonas sp. E2T0]|uniref:DUF7210 family protein n=1 Tax=Entomomonas sp. E2T0 TaxID=2930213 RepID=UPI0022282E37|nr:hypothetical protein [Entomomonas sp. E2T0]UYZ84288.1 hypothetical protein MTZ49_01530 [Entomomonas sp. E2T0]
MPKFIVNKKLRHNNKVFTLGDSIELTKEEAAPLLEAGAIIGGGEPYSELKGLVPNNADLFSLDEAIEQIAMDDEYFNRVLVLRGQIDKDADLIPADTELLKNPVATPAVEPVAETPAVAVDPAPEEPTAAPKTTAKKSKK